VLPATSSAEPSELSLQFRSSKYVTVFANRSTKQSILFFALDITEKALGWSHQKRPHAPPDIANYLMLSVVIGRFLKW